MRIHLFFLCFCLFGAVALPAQRPAALRSAADKAFDAQRWEAALPLYEQFQEAQPGDLQVLTRLGICHFELGRGEKSAEYLAYVFNRTPEKGSPELYYAYARTLHHRADFQKAAQVYKQFLRVAPSGHPLRARVRDDLRRCLSGESARANEAVALLENLGDAVNTAGDEFAPLPSVQRPGRVYYSAARPGCQGGKRNDQGYADEAAGHWCSDMFFTERQPAGYTPGGALSALINSPRHEVALDFGMNGQILYYFRGFTLYGGEILADTATQKDEYALQPPAFDGPVRGENGETSLFFFNDQLLLFAANRPGGYGGLDIWSARLAHGVWGEPQNLRPVVNSAYDDTAPFLAPDGRTLFFSSNRLESIGGLDVFQAVYDDVAMDWQPPANYGLPVNSPANDVGFRLSADGKYAWLASDRLDGYGRRDLYTVYYLTPQAALLAPSNPPLFADVPARAAVAGDRPREFILPALYYTDDKDLLRAENRAVLEQAQQALAAFPSAKLLLSVHTDGAVPLAFDLYYGIKKSEILADALVKAGVPAARLFLRSAGPYFPASRTVVGAEPYPAGAVFNRRVELRIVAPGETLPGSVLLERRPTPEAVTSGREREFDAWMSGLAYGVRFAETRQILESSALDLLDIVQIESVPGAGAYAYLAGWKKTYAEAARLADELRRAGFTDAKVAPILDGIPIGKAEAVRFVKKYPDLAGYIRN